MGLDGLLDSRRRASDLAFAGFVERGGLPQMVSLVRMVRMARLGRAADVTVRKTSSRARGEVAHTREFDRIEANRKPPLGTDADPRDEARQFED